MKVRLAYGRNGLDIEVPDEAHIVRARPVIPLSDERMAIRDSLETPIAGPTLREILKPRQSVTIVFPDITRPMPNRTVLPVLLEEIESLGVRSTDITLVSGAGTHRPASPHELEELVGEPVFKGYRVINHDSDDPNNVEVGSVDDVTVLLNRAYVEADVRIVTGFVEPHFFAGFSGGPKGVCPGIAGTETILEAHSPTRIANPHATWLKLFGNPIHDFIREAASLAPPSFSLDVTIDPQRRITGVFAGEFRQAHMRACQFVDATSVQRTPGRFEVVVSTNGGHPLDRNLYQAVKGMSAAEQVVHQGGKILLAAASIDGVPSGSAFERLLREMSIGVKSRQRDPELDLWQVQILERVLTRASVAIHSTGLSDQEILAAQLEPVADLSEALRSALSEFGSQARVCVLPEGPLTVAVPT